MDQYNGARYIPTPSWVDTLTQADGPFQRLPDRYEKRREKYLREQNHNHGRYPNELHPSVLMYQPQNTGQYIMNDDRRTGDPRHYGPLANGAPADAYYPAPYYGEQHRYSSRERDKQKKSKDKRSKQQRNSNDVNYVGSSSIPPYFGFNERMNNPIHDPYGYYQQNDQAPRDHSPPAGIFRQEKPRPKKGLRRSYVEPERDYNESEPNPTYATTITSSAESTLERRPSPRYRKKHEKQQEKDDTQNVYDDHIEKTRPADQKRIVENIPPAFPIFPGMIIPPGMALPPGTIMPQYVTAQVHQPPSDPPEPAQEEPSVPQQFVVAAPPPPPPPPPPPLPPAPEEPPTPKGPSVFSVPPITNNEPIYSMVSKRMPKVEDESGIDKSSTDWGKAQQAMREVIASPQCLPVNNAQPGMATPPAPTTPPALPLTEPQYSPSRTGAVSQFSFKPTEDNMKLCQVPIEFKPDVVAEKSVNFRKEKAAKEVVPEIKKDPQNVCKAVGGLPEEQEAYIHRHEEPEPLPLDPECEAEPEPEIYNVIAEPTLANPAPPPAPPPSPPPAPPPAPPAPPVIDIQAPITVPDVPAPTPAPAPPPVAVTAPPPAQPAAPAVKENPCLGGDSAFRKGCEYAESKPIVPEEVTLYYDNDAKPVKFEPPPPAEAPNFAPAIPPVPLGPSGGKETGKSKGAPEWLDLRKHACTTSLVPKPPPVLAPPPGEATFAPAQTAVERVDLRQAAGRTQNLVVDSESKTISNVLSKPLDGPASLQVDERQRIVFQPALVNQLKSDIVPAFETPTAPVVPVQGLNKVVYKDASAGPATPPTPVPQPTEQTPFVPVTPTFVQPTPVPVQPIPVVQPAPVESPTPIAGITEVIQPKAPTPKPAPTSTLPREPTPVSIPTPVTMPTPAPAPVAIAQPPQANVEPERLPIGYTGYEMLNLNNNNNIEYGFIDPSLPLIYPPGTQFVPAVVAEENMLTQYQSGLLALPAPEETQQKPPEQPVLPVELPPVLVETVIEETKPEPTPIPEPVLEMKSSHESFPAPVPIAVPAPLPEEVSTGTQTSPRKTSSSGTQSIPKKKESTKKRPPVEGPPPTAEPLVPFDPVPVPQPQPPPGMELMEAIEVDISDIPPELLANFQIMPLDDLNGNPTDNRANSAYPLTAQTFLPEAFPLSGGEDRLPLSLPASEPYPPSVADTFDTLDTLDTYNFDDATLLDPVPEYYDTLPQDEPVLPAVPPVLQTEVQPELQPLAVPQPVAQPEAVPQQVVQPVAVPQPLAQPAVVPQPVVQPVVVPQPVVQPVVVPQPVVQPVVVPQPVVQPLPEVGGATMPVPVAVDSIEPEPYPESEPESEIFELADGTPVQVIRTAESTDKQIVYEDADGNKFIKSLEDNEDEGDTPKSPSGVNKVNTNRAGCAQQ